MRIDLTDVEGNTASHGVTLGGADGWIVVRKSACGVRQIVRILNAGGQVDEVGDKSITTWDSSWLRGSSG